MLRSLIDGDSRLTSEISMVTFVLTYDEAADSVDQRGGCHELWKVLTLLVTLLVVPCIFPFWFWGFY